ncbi:MAG: putative GAF-sensor signal transduction histidine kinase [Solirubrobacterales bacterium]|nr:putative GAF-sensor signal transduction histidine kinase [Solirubrobacterales bacterium]
MLRLYVQWDAPGVPRAEVDTDVRPAGALRSSPGALDGRDTLGGMRRIRSWLDPGTPSSTPVGIASAVLAVAAGTLLDYPLKLVVDPLSLDSVYIPGVLWVTAKWGVPLGLISALLSGLAFNFFHVPPAGTFASADAAGLVFIPVAAAAIFVASLTQRARSSEIRRRQEVAARARQMAAADEERRRVVRDLHDGAQQRLVLAVMVLKQAQQALKDGDADAGELVDEALQHAEETNFELRELAHGILPAVLTRGGLRAGVDALVSRISLPVSVDVTVERLPSDIEATAYFVVSEALTNVLKHARADGAEVTARLERGLLQVEVRDDGVGGALGGGTTGLGGLEDRVSALDGRLVVDSRPGRGTRVHALLPVP